MVLRAAFLGVGRFWVWDALMWGSVLGEGDPRVESKNGSDGHDLQQRILCFVSAGWSGCQLGANATCGHGERRRLLSCRRSDGATVSTQLCQRVRMARVGQGNDQAVILFPERLLICPETPSVRGGEVAFGAGSAAVGCFGGEKHPWGVSGWYHSLAQVGGFGVGVAWMGHSDRPCTMAPTKQATREIVPYQKFGIVLSE